MLAIEVRSKSPSVDVEVAQFVQYRMSFALDRLRHLRRILVYVEDVNGPKGGTDKRCRIVAEFAFSTILAQETQSTWQSAITRAIHRIARNAARQLQRMNRAPAHRRRQGPGITRTEPQIPFRSDHP